MAAAGVGAGPGVPLTAWPTDTWSMPHAPSVQIRRADLADAGQVGVLTERVYRRRGYARQPGRDWQTGGSTLMIFRLSL